MKEKTKKEKINYYRLNNILKLHATYNMIIGERSNGKTFAVQEYCIEDYVVNGNQMALIRRWSEDFTGKRGEVTFSGVENAGIITKLTKGKFDRVVYRASKFYLGKYDSELCKIITDSKPFCYAFSLTSMEHDKSTSYPRVMNILFDEFLSRTRYLPNEFILFMNTLSTIIRERDNVKIFMCANTVNKYAPYFTEMGIGNIDKMKQGTIDLYNYGDSNLTVAVEYCGSVKGKISDKYFAFDNPKLKMITNGTWEMALYPHLPMKYSKKNIKYVYFIFFMSTLLQCEIIKVDRMIFTYIHRKTSDLKYPEKEIIFSEEYTPKRNHFRRITEGYNEIVKKIYRFYIDENVYYQDNEVGEIVRNYIEWSKSDKGFD